MDQSTPQISSISSLSESGPIHHSYSRKDKSLGLLCINFLRIYSREGVTSIRLEDATTQLGVERRRIYDIVNVLENVGILARKGKSEYSWIGFDGIPKALNALKDGALKETRFIDLDRSSNRKDGALKETRFIDLDRSSNRKISVDNEDDRSLISDSVSRSSTLLSLLEPCSSISLDIGREKSLRNLTQSFLKLFLSINSDLITLDEAAKILLGEAHNPSEISNNTGARAKVRRLYDIANVLSSINLIEKTHHPTTRKPALRWLGFNGVSMSEALTKKRNFGTELTNINYKRNKMNTSLYNRPIQKVETELNRLIICEDLTKGIGYDKMQQSPKSEESSKGVDFGPFRPVSLQRVNNTGKNNAKKIQELESLASTYRPRYHNQALNDLFSHYTEAWRTWYLKVSEKQPTPLL